MSFALGLALVFSAALSGSSTTTATTLGFQSMPQAQSVRQYVESYFADEPVMVAIAGCESKFRQYDSNGQVLRGEVVHEDVGVMQINETYQGSTAKALGLDLTTLQGNTAYARYLYEKEGTTPWNSSKVCWGKSAAAQELALASN